MVELQGKNKVFGNLIVHHKSHVNWPGIETLFVEFRLLQLCFYTVYFGFMH